MFNRRQTAAPVPVSVPSGKRVFRARCIVQSLSRLAASLLLLITVDVAIGETLYGTMYNGTSGGISSYSFSEIDTSGLTAGNAHPLFDFSLPFGIAGMAFNPVSGTFVVMGPTGQYVEINAAAHTVGPVKQITGSIPGAIPGPDNNFTGIEYDPVHGMVASYGQDPGNSNLQNRIVAFDVCTGLVTCFTNPPLDVSDADCLVYDPFTAQLVIADVNNSPFNAVTGLCTTNTISEYATPPDDGELSEPACDATGTIYFSRRETADLWRLSGSTYVQVGPHLASPSTAWAVGLAFGTAQPCTGFDIGPTCWTAVDRNPTVPYDCSELGVHGPPVTWQSSGGNPDGYISTIDGAGEFYWRASSAFVGNQAALCGQALCFDVISDVLDSAPSTMMTPNLVVLTPVSGPPVAYDAPFGFANVPPNTWHHWVVPFDQNYCGWHHPCDGTALAPGELCSVLANLQSMDLLAEYGNANDTGGLDNVCLCPLPSVCGLRGTNLYGSMFESTSGGISTYTFAEVSTQNGNVTPLFNFSVPFGIGGMAFDPVSGTFVVVGGSMNGQITEIDPVKQTVSTQTVTGLPASNTYIQAVEYDENQPAGKQHMLISFGPDNSNADNRLARVNSTTGVVLEGDSTVAVVADADGMAYSSATREFIIADPNNTPFDAIDSVGIFTGGPASPVTLAEAPNDAEYWEPACDNSGRMYFSNRDTKDLSYILKNTTDYVLVGPHTGITPATWAHGLAFGAIPTCIPAPPDMVAWWRFDELTGTAATDAAGSGNHGTYVNGPLPLAGQYVNNALCFDGSNDYVNVPDAPSLNFGTGDFTIDVWVKRDPAVPDNIPPFVILDKRDFMTGVGYSLSISFGGHPILTMSGTNFATTTSPVPADGRWHFVVVTVQRAANGGQFYVDGIPITTFSPLLSSVSNTNDLWIGRGQLSGNQPWLGCIDELELFDRALSPCEVSDLFCAHQAGKCGCPCPGDINGDGIVNGIDVAAFVHCVMQTAPPTDTCLCGDLNGDGSVNVADIAPFVTILIAGQPCPP